MRQFTYKKDLLTKTVVVEDLTTKVSRQRLVFALIFFLLFIAIFCYLGYNTIIKRFDGYVSCKNNEIRMIDDVTIFKFYVKQGDMVKEGDTLFAYFYSNWLYDIINPHRIVGTSRDIRSTKTKTVHQNE